MSKYMSFESESFPNEELLVEALGVLGFENVERGTSLTLRGWDKNDRRVADVIVRRESVTTHRLFGDIGFKRAEAGLVAVIDDMDLDYHLGRDFVTRLRTQYHEAVARKAAKRLGGTLIREQVGKTVKIRVRF